MTLDQKQRQKMVLGVNDYGTLKGGQRHALPSCWQKKLGIIGVNGSRIFQDFGQVARGRNVPECFELGRVPFDMTPGIDEEQRNVAAL